MSKKAIFCLASSQRHAETLVNRLKNRGFQNRDISALYAGGEAASNLGLLVGELAWLHGIGPVCVPGYIGAGPIVRALKKAEGAASTKIGRGLLGLGVPETEAKSFQQKMEQGSVLISYHTEHSEEITRAQAVLQVGGGEDFCGTDETSATQDVSIFGETSRVSVPSTP